MATLGTGGALGGQKSSGGGGRAFLTPSGTFFWLPWPSLGHKNTVRVLVKLVFDNPHLSPHPSVELSFHCNLLQVKSEYANTLLGNKNHPEIYILCKYLIFIKSLKTGLHAVNGIKVQDHHVHLLGAISRSKGRHQNFLHFFSSEKLWNSETPPPSSNSEAPVFTD